jgi:hypothetical protein
MSLCPLIHPSTHPPVSIPVSIPVCAPRRAPAVRIVLVYAYYLSRYLYRHSTGISHNDRSTLYIILRHLFQSPSFKGGLRAPWDLRRRTEIIPVKDPHQNITVGFDQRPRPLHNRYTRTDTCVRWGMAAAYSRYKFVTVSLPKRFRNGRFTSETAVRRFQK